MQPRNFFLDIQSRQFVISPTLPAPVVAPAFFNEDVEEIALYFLNGSEPVDYSANTVKLAVGLTAPAALQTSWTSLGTTVTASITSTVTGGSGVNASQRLTFSGGRPVAGAISVRLPGTELSFAEFQGTSTIVTSEPGYIFENRRVTLNAFGEIPNGTYYMVNTTRASFQVSLTPSGPPLTEIDDTGGDIFPLAAQTPPITSNNLTAAAIQDAFTQAGILQAGGQPLISVSGSLETGFVFEFVNNFGGVPHNLLQITNTLSAAPGLTGNLSFNTNEVAALVAAGNTSGLRMEVEVSDGTLRQTYATSAAIAPDIITSTSPVPLPLGGAVSTVNFDDGAGGTWQLSIDADGVVTTTKL